MKETLFKPKQDVSETPSDPSLAGLPKSSQDIVAQDAQFLKSAGIVPQAFDDMSDSTPSDLQSMPAINLGLHGEQDFSPTDLAPSPSMGLTTSRTDYETDPGKTDNVGDDANPDD